MIDRIWTPRGSKVRVRKDPFWFRYIGGMTREEFIKVLEEKGYSYEMEWNKIVVTHREYVDLNSLKTIPSGVVFKNGGNVGLNSLETLPPGVEFRNLWHVHLGSLETLSPDVEFSNYGTVHLESLETLSPGAEFSNSGSADLPSLKTLSRGVVFKNGGYFFLNSLIGGRFDRWDGNIEGINNKRLLNKMIADGLFDRR